VLVVAGLHVGAIAAVLFWAGRRLRLPRAPTTLFTVSLLFAYVAVAEQRPPVMRAALMAGKLEVSVLDVGQGDSLFVVSPGGKTLLIDGGGAFGGYSTREEALGVDPGEEAVSRYLWSRGFQKLDVVALTHAHQDHLGGLAAILENFRVGKLWIGREGPSVALARLEEIAKTRKNRLNTNSEGNRLIGMRSRDSSCGPKTPLTKARLRQKTMIRWFCGSSTTTGASCCREMQRSSQGARFLPETAQRRCVPTC
jgi:beta-lactamase superfamily II metal-dependent hydrolase